MKIQPSLIFNSPVCFVEGNPIVLYSHRVAIAIPGCDSLDLVYSIVAQGERVILALCLEDKSIATKDILNLTKDEIADYVRSIELYIGQLEYDTVEIKPTDIIYESLRKLIIEELVEGIYEDTILRAVRDERHKKQ